MATKRVTNDVVARLLDQASDVSELEKSVSDAVRDCKIDTIADPFKVAQGLLAYSRHLAEAASQMLRTCEMQRMKDEAAARQKELAELRAANPSQP